MATANEERPTVNMQLSPEKGQTLNAQLSFLPCRHCPKSFATKEEMNSHVDLVHLGRILICDACGKVSRDENVFEKHRKEDHEDALWSGSTKNRDVSTGPLARPFARSLIHSRARGRVNDSWWDIRPFWTRHGAYSLPSSPTTLTLVLLMNQFLAEVALVMVSWVVKVLEATIKSTVSGLTRFRTSAKWVPSMFDTKCTLGPTCWAPSWPWSQRKTSMHYGRK